MPFANLVKRLTGKGAEAAPKAEKKESEAKKKTAGAAGFAAQEAALKPEAAPPAAAQKKGLPESTEELLASAAHKVEKVGLYKGEKALPADIGQLLVLGAQLEGIADAKTLKDLLEQYVDGGEVEVLKVQSGGSSLTWLRFYAGDTEVGYLFDKGAMTHLVSDGWIQARG